MHVQVRYRPAFRYQNVTIYRAQLPTECQQKARPAEPAKGENAKRERTAEIKPVRPV
jgi:hypothetical protein